MGSMGGCSSLAYTKNYYVLLFSENMRTFLFEQDCDMKGSYADKARFLRFVLGECGKSV